MEETRAFNGGLNSNFNAQNQPENTYPYAENWVRDLDGSLRTELGSKNFSVLPDKFLINASVIGEVVVLYFYDSTGEHEIGYVDKDDNYTSVLINSALNFTPGYKLTSRGRVDYRGHRIEYFVDGINPNRVIDLDRDYSLVTDIEGELKLQIDYTLPETKFVTISDDGELPTGIYQFQARLLTSSGNKGIVGISTNPIPIIDETGNGGIPDGAESQSPSSKSIAIDISGIDTKFKFVEIIATTYIGVTNTPKAVVVGRRPITGTTMSFKYSSTTQDLEEVDINEVTIEPVIYTSGKHIEFKDGHLLVAGLNVKLEGNSFQTVANAIQVEYITTELDYTENMTITGQGNKEDFIIPESDLGGKQGYGIETNTVNLKSLRREEVYSLSITPQYTDGTTGSAYHIPAPYINENRINPAVPVYTYRTIAMPFGGTMTLKETTGTGKCGTYISDLTYPSGFNYPTSSSNRVRHHVMPTIGEEPIFKNGKIRVLGLRLKNINLDLLPVDEKKKVSGYIIGYQRRTSINKSILTQGIAQPIIRHSSVSECWVSPFHGKGTYNYSDYNTVSWRNSLSTANTGYTYYTDAMAFYSPESILNNDSLISADYLDRVSVAKGKAYVVASNRPQGNRSESFMHTFMNFTSYENPGVDVSAPNVCPVHKDTITYVPSETSTGKFTPPNFKITGKTISTKNNNGFLFFHTNGNVPLWTSSTSKDIVKAVCDLHFLYYKDKPSSFTLLRDGNTYGPTATTNYADVSRSIYNLRAVRNSQYGEVNEAEYIYMGHGKDTSIDIYNGDTFINKVGILSSTGEPHVNGTSELKFMTLNYIFLESSINTNYRHYKISNDTEKGTVPYFPKQRTLWSKDLQNGLMQVAPKFGHANSYNKQYSFDNGLKKYFPKPLLLEQEVSTFNNRCIYSEVSLEGEQFDANRLFLPNNYQDIPKHKGDITDMFVHTGSLYFHTPQTLFKAFFNEQVTQVTSAGEVSLGNGGVFNRPPMEVFTIAGGYAGTPNKNGINTPFGRVFVDNIQGKVFMLGEGVDEISNYGLTKFFSENLNRGNNFLCMYDYRYRRCFVTNGMYTLSYMPELKSWSSFHTFYPDYMFSKGDRTFVCTQKIIHEINQDFPTFLGYTVDAKLNIVFNLQPLLTKVQDNLFIQSSNVFSSIKAIGESKSSDTRSISLEDENDTDVLCKYRNSQYQLPVPRAQDESRMRGKYITLELVKDNVSPQMQVKYLTLMFRANAR